MIRTASGHSPRARASNSTPVISGIRWSVMMTWTGSPRSTSRASAPLSAVCTSKSRRSRARSEYRISGSSSTTNTGCLVVAIVSPFPRGRPGGQADAEDAAAADLALDVDAAAVVADDAVADRQPQPRPLPHRLGGEERLEGVRQVLRADAAAVVLDLDHRPSLLAGPRADLHDAAGAARLGGVHQDVEENLVDLRRLTLDSRHVIEAGAQLDLLLPHLVAEDLAGGRQRGVEVHL